MRGWLLASLVCLSVSSMASASEGLDRVYTVTVRLTQLVGIRAIPVHLHCDEAGENRTPSTVVSMRAPQIVQEDRWTSTGRSPVHCTVNQQQLTVAAPNGQKRSKGSLDVADAPATLLVQVVHD